MIWELILGGQFIHIRRNSWSNGMSSKINIKGQLCHAEISEDEAQQRFDSEDLELCCSTNAEERHILCDEAFFDYPARLFRVDLLQSCRQIYNEAQHIPYTSNTFSFNEPDCMRKFLCFLGASGNSHNLRVRKLHLALSNPYMGLDSKWHTVIRLAVKQLKHLQQINLDLQVSRSLLVVFNRWLNGTASEQEVVSQRTITSAIGELQKLPLQRVTCVIDDTWDTKLRDSGFLYHARGCWSLADKKKYASFVKDYLLRSSTQRDIEKPNLKVQR